MRLWRPSGWVLALALVSVCGTAFAGVPTRLVYVRAADVSGCPQQPALEDAVTARLGYNPFSPWGDQTIVATISRERSNVLARAELVDHDGIVVGSRRVVGALAQCSEVIASLALAISITLDPMRASAAPEPEPEPEPEQSASAEFAVPETTRSAPTPPSGDEAATSPSVAVVERAVPVAPNSPPLSHANGEHSPSALGGRGRVGLLALVSALPHPSPGAWLGLDLSYRDFSLGLEAFASLASSAAVESGGEVRVSLVAGTVAPCLAVTGGVAVCATGTLGRLSAEGFGISDPRSRSLLYGAVGGRGALTVPIGNTFALLAHADLVATLTRPTFQLDGESVWRPSPIAVWLGLGASARFF